MATVEKSETVTTTYTLTLSKEEADALLSVVGVITGSSECSPRLYTDAVYDALSRAGVPRTYRRLLDVKGDRIHFDNFSFR